MIVGANEDLLAYFRGEYRRLIETGRKPVSRFAWVYPDVAKYPKAAIRPNGEVVGTYYYVRKYCKDLGLTGEDRRDGPITIQVHHLLEDRLMEHFRIRRQDGLSVAVGKLHHDQFSGLLPSFLPRGLLFDIDHVFEGHCEMYELTGHRDWIPIIRAWLGDIRMQILTAYQSGAVIGAKDADVQRVRDFLFRL